MKLGKLGVWTIFENKTAAESAAPIKRIEQHWEAGADHVCIQAIDPSNPTNAIGISNIDEKLLDNLAQTLV